MQKHSWKNVNWIKPVKIIIAAMRGRQRSVLKLSVNDSLEKDLELFVPNLRYYPGMCLEALRTKKLITLQKSQALLDQSPPPQT
jgi:hypothetical protein